jgi:antitoxin VapB
MPYSPTISVSSEGILDLSTGLSLGHVDPCKKSISVVYTGIHVDDNTMTIAKTRTFRSGNSEAVRLPKDAAFGEGVELVVVRSGDVVTLYPAATSIPEMIARLEALPLPTSIEERDDEELPEPAGL